MASKPKIEKAKVEKAPKVEKVPKDETPKDDAASGAEAGSSEQSDASAGAGVNDAKVKLTVTLSQEVQDRLAAQGPGPIIVEADKFKVVDPAAAPAKFISVRSKAERGRRRAGFAFTREETRIAADNLSTGQLEALTSDPELIVKIVGDETKAG